MAYTAQQQRLRQEFRDRQVIAAIEAGHTTGVAALLAAGASVNGSPALRFPPIVHAAGIGSVSMINCLVKHGANVNIGTFKTLKSSDGNAEMAKGCRALHVALKDGHVGAYRALLKAGADPNAADKQGHTPLMAICNTDSVPAAPRVVAARELLEAGGDASRADIFGRTAMHFAVSREDGIGLIDALWSISPSTLTTPDVEGVTPLALAAGRGRCSSITHLLSLGATQPMKFRDMPLIGAVFENHVSAVGALLSAGLEPNGGPEALTYAMFGCLTHRCAKILRLLLSLCGEEEKKRWANLRNSDGPVLHIASSLDNLAALCAACGRG